MASEYTVTGLQHLGIHAIDFEKSLEFYKKLGFEIAWKPDREPMRMCFIRLGNLTIELMSKRDGVEGQPGGSVDHVALDVTDVEKALAMCQAEGYEITEGPRDLPFWDNGVRYFKIKGPNNESIEFSQYL